MIGYTVCVPFTEQLRDDSGRHTSLGCVVNVVSIKPVCSAILRVCYFTLDLKIVANIRHGH